MYKKEEALNEFYKKVASQVKFKKAGEDEFYDEQQANYNKENGYDNIVINGAILGVDGEHYLFSLWTDEKINYSDYSDPSRFIEKIEIDYSFARVSEGNPIIYQDTTDGWGTPWMSEPTEQFYVKLNAPLNEIILNLTKIIKNNIIHNDVNNPNGFMTPDDIIQAKQTLKTLSTKL